MTFLLFLWGGLYGGFIAKKIPMLSNRSGLDKGTFFDPYLRANSSAIYSPRSTIQTLKYS